MQSGSRRRAFTGADAWERIGITEHLGGIYATRELIGLCGIRPGQLVLDIGCGTGFTACLLAKEYSAQVMAADVNPGLLALARKRVTETGVSDRVALALADVQHLPFRSNSFDAAIAESVLIFCDEVQAAFEVYRALRPGGVFGDNELTFLRPPPDWLRAVLASAASGVGISPRFEGQLVDQWESVYEQAGFTEVSSRVHKMSLWQQLASHLRIDGAKKYLTSTFRVVLDPDLRAFLFDKDILRAVVQARSYIGYGLYTGWKADDTL